MRQAAYPAQAGWVRGLGTLGREARQRGWKFYVIILSYLDGTEIQFSYVSKGKWIFVADIQNIVFAFSDNEGYTMNNGFLSYIGKNENTIAYKGESYLGKAEYFFSSNHELLNVKLLNGTIYVYRKAVPGSQTKSTYVGDRNSDSSGKTDGTVVPSINIYNIDRYDLKNDDRENFKVDKLCYNFFGYIPFCESFVLLLWCDITKTTSGADGRAGERETKLFY